MICIWYLYVWNFLWVPFDPLGLLDSANIDQIQPVLSCWSGFSLLVRIFLAINWQMDRQTDFGSEDNDQDILNLQKRFKRWIIGVFSLYLYHFYLTWYVEKREFQMWIVPNPFTQYVGERGDVQFSNAAAGNGTFAFKPLLFTLQQIFEFKIVKLISNVKKSSVKIVKYQNI